MGKRRRMIKSFISGSGSSLRLAALLLALAALGVSIAFGRYNKISENYAEQLFSQTLVGGKAPQYEAARAAANWLGAFMAALLAGSYALIIAVFHSDRKRLAAENALIAEEKLRLQVSEERYRLIAQDSEAIIIEINHPVQTIDANAMYESVTGETPSYAAFIAGENIHPEDRSAFLELISLACETAKPASRELRMREREGGYPWYSVVMSGIADISGRVARLVCKFTNIDAQKRKLELLELRAQTDPLTGLYNKAVTQEIIERILHDETEFVHALLIIDIDDLKGINDKCGHIEGDRAIAELAALIRKHFRATDVAGRIGGDEYMVFLRNVRGSEQLHGAVSALNTRINGLSVGENDLCPVSVSIGAVLTEPDVRASFHGLYKKADAALYGVKRKGKKGFAVFGEIDN